MPKDKNYKKIAKGAAEDKVNNIVFIMKFLNSKGGLDLVREYFAESVPDYIIEYASPGGATKWVMRQWLKRGSHSYLKKIVSTMMEDGQLINPPENYEIIEDKNEQTVLKLKCNYRKRLVKTGKKLKCNFDIQEYYCNHACIPILSRIYADIYCKVKVDLTDEGCIQTIQIDKATFSKDEEAASENEEGKN